MKNIMIVVMLLLSITYAVEISTDVVFDSKTKLEWQNEAVNKIETKSWEDAISYCENLDLDGKRDWRLPNINELQSLIDYGTFSPAIVSVLKDTTVNSHYWSSTTSVDSIEDAMYVHFYIGSFYYKDKSSNSNYVRCVRDK
jgi:hypothetical protein